MATDIIFSTAWECGERGCKAQWHRASYWIDGDGYSVDNYSDGDHEDIEEADLPSFDEVDKTWREYAEYVVKHGVDPLGEYFVRHNVKVAERWLFKFNRSITGPLLIDAQRRGQSYSWKTLPEHVKTYLHIKDNARIHDFATWDEFVQAVPGVQPMKWFAATVHHDRQRDPETVKRELKIVARRLLKSAKKRKTPTNRTHHIASPRGK